MIHNKRRNTDCQSDEGKGSSRRAGRDLTRYPYQRGTTPERTQGEGDKDALIAAGLINGGSAAIKFESADDLASAAGDHIDETSAYADGDTRACVEAANWVSGAQNPAQCLTATNRSQGKSGTGSGREAVTSATACDPLREDEGEKTGAYGNRTHCGRCSRPPPVLKTGAATRRANAPDGSGVRPYERTRPGRRRLRRV